MRIATSNAVPPEEARAALFAGNKRFVRGNGGLASGFDGSLMTELTEGGQKPLTVVLGCADSRAPPEIFFDQRPGDLFVLRTAGNTCGTLGGSLIGSAEYAIAVLGSKHIVVTAHTKCGAVTASVQAAIDNADTSQIGGSIGKVVDDIIDAAREAIKQEPNAPLAEQVALATEINVISTIKKLIEASPIIKAAAANGELQIDGAVYDIFTGEVQWLGQHPDLPEIVGKEMPYFAFTQSVFPRGSNFGTAKDAAKDAGATIMVPALPCGSSDALQRLREGNARFVQGTPTTSMVTSEPADPFAIVIGGGEGRVPIERIFDTSTGELLVQRVMGNVAGEAGGTLLSSIEFAVSRYNPKVLMVMGDSSSRVLRAAINKVDGGPVTSSAVRYIMDRVSVGVLRAKKNMEGDTSLTAAGRELKATELAAELNAFYQIERLLTSKIIRDAVHSNGLELHAAVLSAQTGVVEFLGMHPANALLLQEDNSNSNYS